MAHAVCTRGFPWFVRSRNEALLILDPSNAATLKTFAMPLQFGSLPVMAVIQGESRMTVASRDDVEVTH